MAKFIISYFTDVEEKRHYYISFNEQRADDAEYIAEELNIPLEKYIEICKNSGAYKLEEVSEYEDSFDSIYEAQNALQEVLEFSIEYNKNKQDNCNCEEGYTCDIIPKFPDGFSSDGKEISNERINEIIKTCICRLENNEEIDSMDVTEGNTLIMIDKNYMEDENPDCEGCDQYYYTVVVGKNIYEYNGFEDLDCELLEDNDMDNVFKE